MKEVVDFVDDVLVLERDEVLLAATRSFHVIFVYFFDHNQPGIRVFYLRLTVGEDLLPLSVQKNPNLCMFKVLFLTCFNNGLPRSIMAFCHCFNNGLPRSIGHLRRGLTNRQAFSLGVIDLFSVCIEQHLTDCGIVVIHVLGEPLLGEPLLGHGLLIELDVRLFEEVVLGLMTSGGEVLVIGPHLLGDSAQGYLLLNLGEVEG